MINFISVMENADPDTPKTGAGSEDEPDKARSEFIAELLGHLVNVGESIAVQNPFLAKPKTAGARSQFPANAS